MNLTNEILRSLLESDDYEDELNAKEFNGFSDEALAQQKNELLPKAIEQKSRYLGLPFVGWSEHTNPQGETYIFAQFGKRRPRSCMSTLLYLNPTKGWVIAESEEDDFKDVAVSPVEPVKYLGLGSTSHGTMREEDLIPAFLNELRSVAPDEAEELRQTYVNDVHEAHEQNADQDELNTIDTEFCWETLVNALQNHCPPYAYFGSNEGDGSDYGVWVSTESIADDLRYEDTEKLQSMVKGQPMPTGSQYVIVTDAAGDYEELLDGVTGEQIWRI